jgi:hypothetical protein
MYTEVNYIINNVRVILCFLKRTKLKRKLKVLKLTDFYIRSNKFKNTYTYDAICK